jgi:hypothetical protein
MVRKHPARWGDLDIEVGVHEAPAGTLHVVAADDGRPVRQFALWVDMPPQVRAAAPWILDGYVHGAPEQDRRVAGLGLVPQTLRIFPTDTSLSCSVVEVPGGEACRDVRVELPAAPSLVVRTEPPEANATVQVFRRPSDSNAELHGQVWERAQGNPNATDYVLVVATGRTDTAGIARLRGGAVGADVIVSVRGGAQAGEATASLAPCSEVVVAMAGTASLDVVLEEAPPRPLRLALVPVGDDGEAHPFGAKFAIVFGATQVDVLSMVAKGAPGRTDLAARLRSDAMHHPVTKMIDDLLADQSLDVELRADLERLRHRDPRTAARIEAIPAGRYRVQRSDIVMRRNVLGPVAAAPLAEIELAPGEHRELLLEDREPPRLELDLVLPEGLSLARWLVDEADGALVHPSWPRPGRVRLLVQTQNCRHLSRDVVELPEHGLVRWKPDLMPQRVLVAVRTEQGRPVADRALSRVPADRGTAGWQGRSLGRTDARGMVEMDGSLQPFRLRVEGVADALGPFRPDPRLLEQTIEVVIPEGEGR